MANGTDVGSNLKPAKEIKRNALTIIPGFNEVINIENIKYRVVSSDRVKGRIVLQRIKK